MFTTVDGLTIAQFRRHPIRQVLQFAGYGGRRGLPSEHELDALKLPGAIRKRLLEGCCEAAAIKDEGRHAEAWAHADTLAAELISGLDESMFTPEAFARRTEPPDMTASMTPAELAALAHTNGGTIR